jgi:zinc protease
MLEKYTLRNGIPLFIVETHGSPVVSIQAWVTRGSAHENEKVAGISHFLEHALFKGTKRREVGEVALEIESRGGEINAFTSFEETAFYATLASRYFTDGLDIIADMMTNPTFDKAEMEREREVILEEIKRAHDSPYKMVSMNLWKTAFQNTPFGRPVLGYQETVEKINHVTLRNYFERNYHTGTMAVFIVGDVEKEKAFEEAQRKFARVARGPKKQGSLSFLIPRSTRVRVTAASRDLQECHVQIGIPSPAITSPMIPALDLICSAMGQGESSRLYQRLVKEKKLALEAHFGLTATSHCGLAALTLLVAPEHLNDAVKEGLAVITEAAAQGLDQSEIERVKTSLEADVISGKETVEGYARRLGYYYCEFGDPEYEGKYLQSLLSVEKEKAREALFNLFNQKPVVSIVHPTGQKIDKTTLSSLVSRPPLRQVAHPPQPRLPDQTARGPVRFLTKSVGTLPTIALRLLFLGGTREESLDKQGVGNLFQRVWTSGTRSYNALQIAQMLESLGASVHAFCGKNTCGISIECLSKHWKVIKPLVNEILLHPSFPQEEFETEKSLVLREILSERDSPGQLCQLNFMSALYGDHPYGRAPVGTTSSVEKITIQDLKDFFRNYIHQGTLVASSVGDFERNSWLAEIQELTQALPASGKKPLPPFGVPRPSELKIVTGVKTPLFQSHLLVGFVGASFKDEERFALKLLSSCLSGQGGRLFLELRDRQSLAYQVSPLNSDSPEAGMFGFYIGCSPEKWERSLTAIRKELDKVLNRSLDAKELDRAKEYWIGRFELDMQRNGAQAMLFGLDEIYGLGFRHSLEITDKIKSVTAKQIQSAAQKFLTPSQAVISLVHNTEVDSDRIRKAWLGVPPEIRSSREKTASDML